MNELGRDYRPGSVLLKGWTYSPIPFDECKFPCHRKEGSWRRWNVIAEEDFKGKTVLDLGCTTGFFSFQAMKAGGIALGIDRDSRAIDVANAVFETYKLSHNLNGRFLVGSVELVENADIVFAMSVLNWIGKKGSQEFLKKIRPKILFIEMPLSNDGMGPSWFDTEKQVKDWVETLTSLKGKAVLQTDGPGGKTRTLWRFK